MSIDNIILGAGCFWGVEHYFAKLEGVVNTEVGYSGGLTESPTYEDVCRKDTMHAEVVRIQFDDSLLSKQKILEHFFAMHNPTTLNRQGPDVGTQYRSVIFYTNEADKILAQQAIEQAQSKFADPIMTSLEEETVFWRAEEYHQQYFQKRGIDRGCH